VTCHISPSPQHAAALGGHYFLVTNRATNQPAQPNGPIFNLAKILRNLILSAAKAEVGALFLNAREGTVLLRNTLDELVHVQPVTPLQTDKSTADGIINGTVKQQRSKAIDMRFYWVRDRSNQGHFNVFWAPGRDNLGDYFTKQHPPSHHRLMRPVFLPEKHAIKPRFLRGCINSRDQGKVTRKPNRTSYVRPQTSQLNHRLQIRSQ
jgi:hypothetical protein